jgi:hypothetical protein
VIINDSRGWVRLSVNGRLIKIYGEQIAPKDEPKYFVTSMRSLSHWETGEAATDEEMAEIKATLEKDFEKAGNLLRWI